MALGDPIGGPWRGAGQNQHRRSVVGTEEAHKMRLGKSHEGLTTGPHVAASERERGKNGRLTHATVKASGST
jgi:hypothetical protein